MLSNIIFTYDPKFKKLLEEDRIKVAQFLASQIAGELLHASCGFANRSLLTRSHALDSHSSPPSRFKEPFIRLCETALRSEIRFRLDDRKVFLLVKLYAKKSLVLYSQAFFIATDGTIRPISGWIK